MLVSVVAVAVEVVSDVVSVTGAGGAMAGAQSSTPSPFQSGPWVGSEHARTDSGCEAAKTPPPQAQHAVGAMCPSCR